MYELYTRSIRVESIAYPGARSYINKLCPFSERRSKGIPITKLRAEMSTAEIDTVRSSVTPAPSTLLVVCPHQHSVSNDAPNPHKRQRKGEKPTPRKGDLRCVSCVDRAHMFKRVNNGRVNGCWVSPVVAAALYYGFPNATPDSVIETATAGGGDIEESAAYVLWEQFHVGTTSCIKHGWHNDDDPDDPHVWFHGLEDDWKITHPSEKTNEGMFVEDYGTEKVSEKWFAALRACIDSDNLALLLAQRLEAGEARAHKQAKGVSKDAGSADAPPPPTHYLLLVGYQVRAGRSKRSPKKYSLFLKDSEEGDRVVEAQLEEDVDNRMVLKTTREDGVSALDRFRPLECYLICGKSGEMHSTGSGPSEADCR